MIRSNGSNDNDGGSASRPITPEERLAFFLAGVMRERAGTFEEFLPRALALGANRTALYVAGAAAWNGQMLRAGAITLFPRQVEVVLATVEFFVSRELMPYIDVDRGTVRFDTREKVAAQEGKDEIGVKEPL